MSVKCPKCQSDNTDTAKFCSECASPLQPSKDIGVTKTIETPVGEFTRGTLFAERYEIIEELGKGGMGNVYRVEDTRTKEEIALKLIKPEIASDKKTIERFRNELITARKIRHKNVCGMYDLGEYEGACFITMEYVPGEDLKSLIRRVRLDIGTVISIGKQICEGLAEAHRLGVVHRDLKPSNVMIDKEGDARIMDFGIAQSIETKGITERGVMIGTPEYMSPEQAEVREVDQRSDIYSLGVILYEMTTGKVPFEGETAFSIALKHKNEMPREPKKLNAQIPDDLSRLILRCMDKEKDKRYQSASELFSELIEIEKSIPTTERVVSRLKHKTKRITATRRKRLIIYCAVGLLSILIILGGLYFLKGKQGSIDYIAMLPFNVMGGDRSDQAFCDGLEVDITRKLAKVERFQKTFWILDNYDIRKAGIKKPEGAQRDLGVNQVLTGSMKIIDNMISLTLNLVDTKTLRQLRSLSITDHIDNLSIWQSEIFIKAAELLDLELKPQIRKVLSAQGTASPGAYKLYIKGLGYMTSYKEKENLNTAISLFEQAIETAPSFALCYKELGRAYKKKSELTKDPTWLEKAESYCNRGIQIDDKLVDLFITLGLIHRDSGRNEDAIEDFRNALNLDPENYEATLWLAESFEMIEKKLEAEETYKEAIRLREGNYLAYGYLGYFYYVNYRFAEAKEMFLKWTELVPCDYIAHNSLGGTYYNLDQKELSKESFEKSYSIKPNPDACTNLGTLFMKERRWADAVIMLEEAIKLGVEDDRSWSNLADAYEKAYGNMGKALQAYEKAIKFVKESLAVNPKDAYSRSRLALYYLRSGDHKNALTEIARAQELLPNNPYVLSYAIRVYELSNQRDQAIQALENYIEYGGALKEIQTDLDLSELRNDPRYKQLEKNRDQKK